MMAYSEKKRPNVLLILCDQLQASAVNDSVCHTPNFDRLAAGGLRFSNAYTPCPVCSPARASLMTGLYPHNHGVQWVTHTTDNDQGLLRKEHTHWAQTLSESGYQTAFFGKWHIEKTEMINQFGWDYDGNINGINYKNRIKDTADYVLSEEDLIEKVFLDQPPGYSRRLMGGVIKDKNGERPLNILTEMVCDYIKDQALSKKPWCCMLSTPEPHDPFICSEKFFTNEELREFNVPSNWNDDLLDKPELYRKANIVFKDISLFDKKKIAKYYYSLITELDNSVGEILTILKEQDEFDNTIIILTSDHGEFLGAHGLYFKNIGSFEEAYRIPLIICGPGIVHRSAGTIRIGLHDLGPTLLDFLGEERFQHKDSKSFSKILRGETLDEEDYYCGFAESFGGRILLTQRIVWKKNWKYVFNGFGIDELYDLENDPAELNNQIFNTSHEEILQDLVQELWKFLSRTGDKTLYNTDYPALRLIPYGPFEDSTKIEVPHY